MPTFMNSTDNLSKLVTDNLLSSILAEVMVITTMMRMVMTEGKGVLVMYACVSGTSKSIYKKGKGIRVSGIHERG